MPAWFDSIRNRHFFALDVGLFLLASALSFVLHWSGFGDFLREFLWFSGLSLLLKTGNAFRIGVYRRHWLFAGAYEVMNLIVSVGQASVLLGLVMYLIVVPLRLLDGFPWPVLGRVCKL